VSELVDTSRGQQELNKWAVGFLYLFFPQELCVLLESYYICPALIDLLDFVCT
jgi:hypothetical protein